MATYVVGDIQGCNYAFQGLLAKINFDPLQDRLWLVGDVVNRGAGSLPVLRWIYEHQHCVTIVLGNHDLHAIMVMEGYAKAHRGDTLQDLLEGAEGAKLLTWLRHQRMAFAENEYLMVHAGVLPQWTAEATLSLASEVESALRTSDYKVFLAQMYGNLPNQWHDELQGIDRLRLITNALTRLRVCDESGAMEFKFKGVLEDVPQGYLPWFDVLSRKTTQTTILFGHWSALGLQQREKLYALDTGCLWGGYLSALRLEDKAVFQVKSDLRDAPIRLDSAS